MEVQIREVFWDLTGRNYISLKELGDRWRFEQDLDGGG